jgi:hypothetical protein
MEFVTPQEQQLLTQLTQRINETQLQEKDPDAENLLGHELGSNPDAIYILAQTVLVQNIALDQAKAQIAQLQQQLQQSHQPAHTTSFLGRLLGDRDPEPVQPQPLQNQQGQFQQPPYQPVPQYAQTPPQYAPAPPQYGQPQYQQAQYVPVHGIGGGHGGYGMMGSGMGMGGGFDRPGGETVVNNYYDGAGGGGDNLRGFESGDPHSHEPADRLDDGAAGKSYDAVTGDNSADSLAGLDDSGSDDTSAFDSGQDDGGGDSGGGDSL